jgi:hypothetical protein
MSVSIVSFPVSFGERVSDRDFIMRLRAHCGLGDDSASMVLVRLWFSFAKGDGPSMKVGEFTDLIIEEACGYSGEKGLLVKAALDSTFMVQEGEGENSRYLLSGYSDSNSASISKMTSKGGKLRWVEDNIKKSKAEADDLFKFMSAMKSPEVSGENDEALSKRAMMIGVNLCRSVNLDSPGKDDFEAGYFRKCLDLAREFDDGAMRKIFRYIAVNKGDESLVPRDRDLLCSVERLRGYFKADV